MAVCEAAPVGLRARARRARQAQGALRAPVTRRPAVQRRVQRRPTDAAKRWRPDVAAPIERESLFGGAGVAGVRESEMV